MSSLATIFVVGNSRSGTTMMGRIMGAHQSVLMLKELHFFEELCNGVGLDEQLKSARAKTLLAELLSTQRQGYMAHRDSRRYQAEAAELIAGLGEEGVTPAAIYRLFLRHEPRLHNATIACEQTPRNVFYLAEVAAHVPGAAVIEMVRDPRDILVSKKHKWKRLRLGGDGQRRWRAALLSWANYHPLVTSRLWVSAIRAGRAGKLQFEQLGLPHVNMRYEDFVGSPEESLRAICRAIGLSYEPGMLDVPRIGSSILQDNAGGGVDGAAAGRWKAGALSSTELWLCQRIAAAEIQECGYGLEKVSPNVFMLTLIFLQLPLKIVLAMALNWNRIASFREAIARRMFAAPSA